MIAAIRRIDPLAWLAVPATAYLAFAFALPLGLLLVKSVWTADGFTLASYVKFFADPFSWRVLTNTLKIAFLVTLVTLLLGYPVAFALAMSRGWLQVMLLVAMILPLSIGAVVKAFSWQIVLRRDGVVNRFLEWTGLIDEPVRFLFTETGLVLGAANIFLPFMVLPIYSVVRLIDPRLSEAAATLGAGPVYGFLRITAILSLPGVVAGIAFVFSLSISMYVIPSLLIGDRYQLLATLTGRSFLFLRNETLGSTVAVILLIIAIAVVMVSSYLSNRLRSAR